VIVAGVSVDDPAPTRVSRCPVAVIGPEIDRPPLERRQGSATRIGCQRPTPSGLAIGQREGAADRIGEGPASVPIRLVPLKPAAADR